MSWTLIDTATEGDAELELYGKDGIFMIRANGLELMNGFCHDSEDALGERAAELAPPQPRILLGGLGLGYTAAALARACPGGSIVVAEFSKAVIGWFERQVRASVLPESSANLDIRHADVARLLAPESYDLIVLDIDNGPEALVTARNDSLYALEGLRSLHRSLCAGGKVLLWSGFESAAFGARAAEAGFGVRCETFLRGRVELSHYIYVLTR
jgi:spermidine synthase